MQNILKILAQTTSTENEVAVLTAVETFWDPGSIIVCTVGLCVGIIWLFWFGGFTALQNAPVRRFRRHFIFWPLTILTFWVLVMGVIQTMIKTDGASYFANVTLELGLTTAMLMIARRSFARGLKGFGINPKLFPKDLPWSAINLLGIFPLVLFGLWSTIFWGRLFKGDDFSLEMHQTLETLAGAGITLKILVVIFAALIVPVFEELLFRGFFQTSLRSLLKSPWAGIILTSIFFAILHSPTHIPALFMLSVGLGYAYERSGSLLRPILMHVMFNGFNIILSFLLPS